MEPEDWGLGYVDGWRREGLRSRSGGVERLMEEMDWARVWYGAAGRRFRALMEAGRAGTGGIEDADEDCRRRTGGAWGWLRLTLPAAAAVVV